VGIHIALLHANIGDLELPASVQRLLPCRRPKPGSLEEFAMKFGIHLVRSGALSAEDFITVVERQLSGRPPLGMLAIESRMLSMKQLFLVLKAQAEAPKPFGQLAIELGFLANADVLQLIGMQSERCRRIEEIVVEMGLLDAAVVREQLQILHAKYRTQEQEYDNDESVIEVQKPAKRGTSKRPVAPSSPAATKPRRAPRAVVKSRRAATTGNRKTK
jgi:hypothetical protein